MLYGSDELQFLFHVVNRGIDGTNPIRHVQYKSSHLRIGL